MRLRYTVPAPVKPCYSSEHRRMKPVIEMARTLDIATNPAISALYEAGSAGFQIWCSANDNPGGDWKKVRMTPGAFKKPAEYLASVNWKWEDETIVGLELSTCAYALADHFPNRFSASLVAERLGRQSIRNRADDVAWAKAKIQHLFRLAGVALPTIYLVED